MPAMDRAEHSPTSQVDAPFQHSALPDKRRKSIPSRALAASPPPASDPASPEVISSLISSLSTISVPLQTHFDSVPRIDTKTDPGSPVYLAPDQDHIPDQRPSSAHELGLSLGAFQLPEETAQSPFLHPDDAAVAPIVRMARAPPPSKSKVALDPPLSPGRPTSRGSFTSSKAAYEDSAFGMITAEPGPRLSTANSVASSGSKTSLKHQISILKRTSREFPSEKERQVDRLRKANSCNDGFRHNIPRSRASVRSLYSMADVAEEGRALPFRSATETATESSISRPSSKERRSLQGARESMLSAPGGIGSGRSIPARESSLRHKFSSSPKHRRSSTRHSRYSSTSSREMKVDSAVSGVGSEADQVTKRILELKDQQQKIKTELELDDIPSDFRKEPIATPAQQLVNSTGFDGTTDSQQTEHPSRFSFDESAPAPAVLTGKSRSTARISPPFTSRSATTSIHSFDKFDPFEKASHRNTAEPPSPFRHQRSRSNASSPTGYFAVDERPSSADSIDLAIQDYVTAAKLTQRVIHPASGRSIAFSEVGDPNGHVVLCCLGMGLTRYLMAFYDELARSLHLRLITLDRPGVGESAPYINEPATPLSWPDDVAIVCNHLKVTKFSIMAHSAGAIYALATALRIPQHIRGRIHLLAPWIPPSQLSSFGSLKAPVPTNAVPYTQRILRALPTSILKVANSSFMSAASASLTSSLPKSPRRAKRKALQKDILSSAVIELSKPQQLPGAIHHQSGLKGFEKPTPIVVGAGRPIDEHLSNQAALAASLDRERQVDYDNRLTHRIWDLATTNANPAVDLLVCLERRQSIGFRYVDITRNVVIHHGSRDTRVPVENVKWLGKTMRRCEVRVLEGEGHGLMASATVMGNVLMEIAKEWEDWMIVVQGKRKGTIGARSGIAVQA
ncbi:hydrolase, alpha/beta fold family protein [Aspergillus homomorphus CBS 101889]|uniref:Hydrolase, alpha/beta fold family protein n=1 Tax=Aspergillus homomorphus (strain CBS 101889) TaxID=1450537 RepID=A0A395HR19_ASPHC|nr:hydrolase, alpha/beta fold family protein [Aspergillus homomorphus CBS 101889]RAL09298.1 hydrolase, alpha/beta fold family protein [Aspergillus homomorphus CBS 101889]